MIPLSEKDGLLRAWQRRVADAVNALRRDAPDQVSAASSTQQSGTLGASVIYTSADLLLPAGAWLVFGGLSVINLSVADTVSVGLWSVGAGADVALSRLNSGPTNTTLPATICIPPTHVNTPGTYQLRANPNGGSTVRITSTAAAGAPAAWLKAIRVDNQAQ